jgi:two-component system, sensor histidine kinase ChiS
MKKKALLFTLIVLPLLLVYLITEAYSPAATSMPKAQQGVLDLRDWDFERDGIIPLNGEWEFYWNQLLTYPDLHDGTSTLTNYSTVPSMWTYYAVDGKNLPGFGYATYRLKIKTNDKDSLKGLKIASQSTTYKLMVDNNIVAENGRVGTNEKTTFPQYKPLIRTFQSNANEFEIIVQVANFIDNRGGLCSPIFLGTDKQIAVFHEESRQRNVFLLGALFIMILYHLAIFLLQKRYNYKAELYFVFIMLLFALRALFVFGGEYLILDFFPSLSVENCVFIEYTTICWALPSLALFMQELYPDECSPRILKIIVTVASLFTLINATTPMHFYTGLLLLVQCLSVIAAFYYVYAAWLAMIHKRSGAALLLSTVIFATAAFMEESFYHWNMIQSKYGGVFLIVSFVFIFVQSFILAQRSSQAFADVKALSNKLISLDKLKDEFMANTSHELRTPLSGMIAITESVLESAAVLLPRQQKENLTLVISSGKRLANLVNDILDYEKLKHGDIHLNKQSIDIRQVIPAALEVSKYLLLLKPITLISKLPDTLPPIEADENRFTQIIYNLLGNAIKFTEQGTITISAVQNKDRVEIAVEDTGIGIPSDKIDTIFKSFEQIDASLTGNYGGTGLGLSITKYLLESQGGQIWVTSTPGKGSTFTISLPVSTTPTYVKDSISKDLMDNSTETFGSIFETPAHFPKNGDFTVLLVDDDTVNLQALVNIVAAENYSAIAVTNGMDALKVLSQNKTIDLVILDIMLPTMSGYEVCRKIRENYSLFELPVLMMTAQNSANSLLTGFASGANDFLSKPFDSNELKARMKTLLQLKNSVNQAIQSEMAFLLAQIKPHFLYNALNTIMSFCWTDAEKAGQLLLSLSNYLRGSFNFNSMNPFISLEKELEFVESYLDIEKARFEEKLTCQFDITVPLDYMIPTLIIQPLVENAIKHGILPKKAGGTVMISAKQQGTTLFITIKDNGVGIPQDKLADILADSNGKSVGLRNINKRLRRIYGEELKIVSTVDAGTTVSIKIPCERKEM